MLRCSTQQSSVLSSLSQKCTSQFLASLSRLNTKAHFSSTTSFVSNKEKSSITSPFVQGVTGSARPLSLPRSKLPITKAIEKKSVALKNKTSAGAGDTQSSSSKTDKLEQTGGDEKLKQLGFYVGVVEQLVPYQPINANAKDKKQAESSTIAKQFQVDESTKVLIARLYKSDPATWTLRALCRKFNLPVKTIAEILHSFKKPNPNYIPEDLDHKLPLGTIVPSELLNIAKNYIASYSDVLDQPLISLEEAASKATELILDEVDSGESPLPVLQGFSAPAFDSKNQIVTSPTATDSSKDVVQEFLEKQVTEAVNTANRTEIMDYFYVDFSTSAEVSYSNSWPVDPAEELRFGGEETTHALSLLFEIAAIAKRRENSLKYGRPSDAAAYIPDPIGTLPPGADGRSIKFNSYPKLALVDDSQFFKILKENETRDTRAVFNDGIDYKNPRNQKQTIIEKRPQLGAHAHMIALVDKSRGKTITTREMTISRRNGNLTEPSPNERYVLDHMVFSRPFKKLKDVLPLNLPHPDDIVVG